jgi:hypothetical protein
MAEIRTSTGAFRLLSEAEIANLSDNERVAYSEFAALFAKRDDLEARRAEARVKLDDLERTRNEAAHAVSKFSPNASAEQTFHIREWIKSEAAQAARERGQ